MIFSYSVFLCYSFFKIDRILSIIVNFLLTMYRLSNVMGFFHKFFSVLLFLNIYSIFFI